MVDHFTKYYWAKAYATKEAQNVCEFLEEAFQQYGPPERALSDNGMEFVAGSVKAVLAQYNVKEAHGAPYHPQTQGAIERTHSDTRKRLWAAIHELNLPNEPDLATINRLLKQRCDAFVHERHSVHGEVPWEVG